MIGEAFTVPGEGRCPVCAKPIVTATKAVGERAGIEPGDLTLCLYCCSPFQLGPNLELQLLDEAQVAALPEHTRAGLQRVIAAIADARRGRGARA